MSDGFEQIIDLDNIDTPIYIIVNNVMYKCYLTNFDCNIDSVLNDRSITFNLRLRGVI